MSILQQKNLSRRLHSRDKFQSRRKFYSKECPKQNIVIVNSIFCRSICEQRTVFVPLTPFGTKHLLRKSNLFNVAITIRLERMLS